VVALPGYERDDLGQSLRGQASAEVGGVPGLAARPAAGGRLDDRLGGIGRVGRGGQRRVAGVLTEAPLQVADTPFQGGEALQERGDQGIALAATGADRLVHSDNIDHQSAVARDERNSPG
jgi:hypothetical protein